MMTLNKLFNAHGSDKGTSVRPAHGYGPVYEALFSNMNIARLLEVGVEYGNSLRAWADYLPNAEIYGIDIKETHVPHPRIKTFVADQNDLATFKAQSIATLPKMDVIIDDGGHCMNHHAITLNALWGHVRPGGYYIIEDAHTCNLASTCTMYGQKLMNEEFDTLTMFAEFQRTGTLSSPWIRTPAINDIARQIAGVRIIGDDNKETDNYKSIAWHGLIIIQKKR
jgi:trans-aconitate methyltransferase